MPSLYYRGGPQILASPGRRYAAPQRNFDGGMEASSRPLKRDEFAQTIINITGQTLNSSLVAIPNCTVDLFISATDQWLARTTSDGSGNFIFYGPGSGPFFMRAVDATGNPVGTTVDTVVPG